jgi:hypothetical protein
MVETEQRVAQESELTDCPGCSERLADCCCDEPWQGPFKFSQLGERAQDRAVDWMSTCNCESFDPLDCMDYNMSIIRGMGFEIGTRQVKTMGRKFRDEPDIGYSLGDHREHVVFPANWSAERLDTNAVLSEAPIDQTLIELCIRLASLRMQYPTSEAHITLSRYAHSDTMNGEFWPYGSANAGIDDAIDGHEEDETITAIARDTASWLLAQFRSEWENCSDRERCEEDIESGEHLFDSNGDRAHHRDDAEIPAAERNLERDAALLHAVQLLTSCRPDDWRMLNASIFPRLTTREIQRVSKGIDFVCGLVPEPPRYP